MRLTRLRSTPRILTAIYGVGLVGVLTAWAGVLAPWFAAPSTPEAVIAARWAVIEVSAASRSPAGDPTLLLAALDASEGETDASQRRALELLLAWEGAGGGVGETLCLDPRISAMGLAKLGAQAVAAAGSPEDPAMSAALRLAAALRERGPGLMTLIGLSITSRALDHFEAAGWRATPHLRALRWEPAQISQSARRFAVCDLRAAEEELRVNEDLPGSLAASPLERGIAAVAFDRERELQHLRVTWMALLEGGAHDEGAREGAPASLLVRASFPWARKMYEGLHEGAELVNLRIGRLGEGPEDG